MGFSQSRFAARLQNLVSARREASGMYDEVAAKLPLPDRGRLLEVGTGSGTQLRVIHAVRPDLELFGLDISGPAIEIARANLAGLGVDLRQGSIERTTYDGASFDVVTASNSMSYWANLVACLDEIHRILKPGGVAVLFEPQKEIDMDRVVAAIRAKMADAGPLRRWGAVTMNRWALRRGRRVGLRLYSLGELADLIRRSRFGKGFSLERDTLMGVPIFVRITLHKQPVS